MNNIKKIEDMDNLSVDSFKELFGKMSLKDIKDFRNNLQK